MADPSHSGPPTPPRRTRGCAGNVGDVSAIQQLSQDFGLEVRAIVTLADVVEYLEETSRFAEYLPAMREYRRVYGV